MFRNNKMKFNVKIIFSLIILFIIFFSYNLNLTWDSSEYIGMAELIGMPNMKENWISHRGIGLPLLIKLSQIFGKNQISLLLVMFVFYFAMIISLYIIYKKLKENCILKNKYYEAVYIIYSIILIILNPVLFGYYHTVLTEFVGITLVFIISLLSWLWINFKFENNKIRNDSISYSFCIYYSIYLSCKAIFYYYSDYSNYYCNNNIIY